jgi:hypothetical protein
MISRQRTSARPSRLRVGVRAVVVPGSGWYIAAAQLAGRRMNRPGQGYLGAVLPDDAAGRPLTPGEQTAIADLERRLLLETVVPGHEKPRAARPVRFGRARRPAAHKPAVAVPLLALGVAAVGLLVLVVLIGAGLLGAAAVLASVVATALLWPLLPARIGGPVRPARRPLPARRPS